MSRELDALVATAFHFSLEPPCGRYHETDGAEHEGERWYGWCHTCGCLIDEATPEPLRYSTDPAAAAHVEDEIERRGLTEQYVDAMLDLLHINAEDRIPAHYQLWALIRATPEQRCRAALVAVGVEL